MHSRFDLAVTELVGLTLVTKKPLSDRRGTLERVFCSNELGPLMSGKPVQQINHTVTRCRGTIRGLHFQLPPFSEAKLVGCMRGAVFDVAVDLRAGSPTFLHWHGRVLSSANREMLLIPEGFAHGFQTLEDDCEMLYCHTAPYAPDHEGGFNANDPTIRIAWPIGVTEISDRDAQLSRIDGTFRGIVL
ncbi:MAG TPA: dTDP-4-dehydrorhamnose 3,5-epimerase family protein [Microvirga sp.]|nr:dTDP-4-dehydrorhamnose 3,5-epimerase family protein [Microvirga sp.]